MKVCWRDQSSRLSTLLPACTSLPLSYDDPTRLREQHMTIVVHTAPAVTSLLSYDFRDRLKTPVF